MLISLAFGILHSSIFFNKFHHYQFKIPGMFLFSGTLSCRQRDLHVRMFVIYKLCGVGNESEEKRNAP